MVCPECSNKMICNQTKNFSDPHKGFNYVERRRVCTACGHRMMTVEIPQEFLSRPSSPPTN